MTSEATTIHVRPLDKSDVDRIIQLRTQLFEDCTIEQHRAEIDCFFLAPKQGLVGHRACFVADLHGQLVGFVEVMVRSHAEGCWDYTADGALGVAHLEGLWVELSERQKGAARSLISACETWAKGLGLTRLASDSTLENTDSHLAHQALGFVEVERAVHFVKRLKEEK